MKQVLKMVALIFMTTLFTNCEQELQVEEETLIANATAGVSANIIRNRIKRRNNGLYKNVMKVSDPLGTTNTAEVQMAPTNGIIPSPGLYFPDLVNENDSIKKFKFNQLNFENGDPSGWPFKSLVTLQDANGEPIDEPLTSWSTVQDNDEVELLNISLKQNGPTGDYKLRTKIQALDSTYSSTVTYYFTAISEDGIIEKDKTIGYTPTVRSINHKGVDGLSAEIEVIDFNDGDDLFNKINPETNTVGVVVEIKNELGQIMDDDLFVVTLENTGPTEIGIRKTKHRLKANGNSTITLNYDLLGKTDAELTELSIPNANADGSSRLVTAYLLPDRETTTFRGTTGPMDNINVGDTYTTMVVAYDENGEIVSALEAEFTVTSSNSETIAESLFDQLAEAESDSFQLKSITVPDLNGDGSDDLLAGAYATARIIPQDGGSETEAEEIDLNIVALEDHRVVFEGDVLFIEPGNVIDMEYQVEYTYFDASGNEIGSTSKMIVAQEIPHPTFETCMLNGSAPNLFEYSVTTNEPTYQNTDIIYVNFGDGSGENLSPECSFPLIRDGVNGDMITFKGTNIRFLDLSQVDETSSIHFSLTPSGEAISEISFINSESIHTLGFFNTDIGEWQCEDNCLDTGDQCNRYPDYRRDLVNGVLTVHVCHL